MHCSVVTPFWSEFNSLRVWKLSSIVSGSCRLFCNSCSNENIAHGLRYAVLFSLSFQLGFQRSKDYQNRLISLTALSFETKLDPVRLPRQSFYSRAVAVAVLPHAVDARTMLFIRIALRNDTHHAILRLPHSKSDFVFPKYSGKCYRVFRSFGLQIVCLSFMTRLEFGERIRISTARPSISITIRS